MKKPEPSVPSKNKTEHYKTLAHAIAHRPSFWPVGQKYLGRIVNTQEGVRLPDNPVFSQARLRVDPNRRPTFCRERWQGNEMSGPVGPLARHTMLNLSTGHGHPLSTQLLYGRHCALTEVRRNTVCGQSRLSDERCTNSAESPRQVHGSERWTTVVN